MSNVQMRNPEQTGPITDAYLARAMAWVSDRGDLLDYDCPDGVASILFRLMRERDLIRRRAGRYVATPKGEALIERFTNAR